MVLGMGCASGVVYMKHLLLRNKHGYHRWQRIDPSSSVDKCGHPSVESLKYYPSFSFPLVLTNSFHSFLVDAIRTKAYKLSTRTKHLFKNSFSTPSMAPAGTLSAHIWLLAAGALLMLQLCSCYESQYFKLPLWQPNDDCSTSDQIRLAQGYDQAVQAIRAGLDAANTVANPVGTDKKTYNKILRMFFAMYGIAIDPEQGGNGLLQGSPDKTNFDRIRGEEPPTSSSLHCPFFVLVQDEVEHLDWTWSSINSLQGRSTSADPNLWLQMPFPGC